MHTHSTHAERDQDGWLRGPAPLIETTRDLRAAVRYGPHAWPGGYPQYALCSDGESLCFGCLRLEYRNILWAVKHQDRSGWRVDAIDVNWEDGELYCSHCGDRIPSAYAEGDNA